MRKVNSLSLTLFFSRLLSCPVILLSFTSPSVLLRLQRSILYISSKRRMGDELPPQRQLHEETLPTHVSSSFCLTTYVSSNLCERFAAEGLYVGQVEKTGTKA